MVLQIALWIAAFLAVGAGTALWLKHGRNRLKLIAMVCVGGVLLLAASGCGNRAAEVEKDTSGGVSLYMTCDQPLEKAQGMAVYEDWAFVLYNTGVCGVYDLTTRDPQPLDVFRLGSYNDGNPTKDYVNHSNSCMFSSIHWEGNPIPLLYVMIGSGIGTDRDGYIYRCAVENIVQQEDGTFKAETLQVISYVPEGDIPEGFEAPCWGCPAFLVDNETGDLYLFSARYRTKRDCVPEGEQNAYIFTRFELPDPQEGGMIHLYPEDMLEQFVIPSDVQFTQGGTIVDGILYYTYGNPKSGYPVKLMVFDLRNQCLLAQTEDLSAQFRQEEIECCAYYQSKLLCNTLEGSIFELGEEIIPLN